jgi:hypothetical protein
LCGERKFGKAEAEAGLEGDVAGMGFASLFDEVLAGGGGALKRDSVSHAFRELDHDHGIGAWGDGSAGHNLDASSGSEHLRDCVAGLDLADATESYAFAASVARTAQPSRVERSNGG